ncbi:sulfotransferase family protein [Cucumibacter marinus]|uniref:sulfotransferase family protein n=1 Tax=Cucumibacter marinus TaxID=1121252 RepID=UPI0003F5AC67|nr:sulfotransferase [Cucumibacter marinus]
MLIIGPMKAGTTWMHDYLAARGDVCLPLGVKETFYFDRYHDKGLDWYEDHFRQFDPDRHRIRVEVAPSLFHSAEAPGRIKRELGQIPLIVARRDPIARSWSHYMHLRRYGYTQKPLAEAIGDFPAIIAASQYDQQIARWRDVLPDALIHELNLDLLKSDSDGYVRELCDVLSIPYLPVPEALLRESNMGAVPPSYFAAKLGRRLSYGLRGLGLYGLINAAKAAGLRRVFFGGSSRSQRTPGPTEAERALLIEQLGGST